MKNIKDYKGKNVFIVALCKKDFLRLVPLLNQIGARWRPDHWDAHSNDYTCKYISILNDCFRKEADGPVINAREFFEAEIINQYEIY